MSSVTPSVTGCMYKTLLVHMYAYNFEKNLFAAGIANVSSLYYCDGSGHCGLLALLLHHYFDGYRCIRQHQRVDGALGRRLWPSISPCPYQCYFPVHVTCSLFTALVISAILSLGTVSEFMFPSDWLSRFLKNTVANIRAIQSCQAVCTDCTVRLLSRSRCYSEKHSKHNFWASRFDHCYPPRNTAIKVDCAIPADVFWHLADGKWQPRCDVQNYVIFVAIHGLRPLPDCLPAFKSVLSGSTSVSPNSLFTFKGFPG